MRIHCCWSPLSPIASCGVDPSRDCGIRHDATVPHGRQELVLSDYAIAIPDQELEKIEYLRFYRDRCPSALELAPPRIERYVAEEERHDSASRQVPSG